MKLIKTPDEIKALPVPFANLSEVVLVNTSAIGERDEVLARSASVERVKGEASQRAAAEMLGLVSDMIAACEKHRKAVKEPFIKVGKLIEGIASGYSTPLEAEKVRLKGLLNSYQAELDRQAAEERRKQAEEARRIEAEKKRQEDESRRKQQELEQAAANAKSQEEAQRIAQQAQALADETALKQSQLALQQASLVRVEEPKPEGLSVRRPWRFEVTDMAVLYKTRPDLCNAPTPKTAEINKLIAGENGLRELAGVRIFQDLDVTSR